MNMMIRGSATEPASSTDQTSAFIHLRVHSAYSLLEGALPVARLAKLAVANNAPALALTDRNNLFGALEFSDKLAGAGVQPIAGLTLAVDFSDRENRSALATPQQTASDFSFVALLAMNEEGYANLMKLSSFAFFDPVDAQPAHVCVDRLSAHHAGLILLTGGPEGPIDKAIVDGDTARARARLSRLAEIFGDRLYVEVQRHGLPEESQAEASLLELAYDAALPLVATNQCYFATAGDHEAHDALICIADGRYVVEDDRRRLTAEHGFKSESDMLELFADLPEATANTVEIARRCSYRPLGRAPILPQYVAVDPDASEEEQLEAEAAELVKQAKKGLEQRLAEQPLAPGYSRSDYEERLEFELGIIVRMKFPGYFLIVADFIKWAKDQDIPVGPGRGSGAGSVVAWALTITDLDPLRFGLLFERFLNPERISMPDFDIDFCQDRRDEVIRYVQEKYGQDRVAQIITHGKLQARAVLRDVGGFCKCLTVRSTGCASSCRTTRPTRSRCRRPSTASRACSRRAMKIPWSNACSRFRRSWRGSTGTPRPMPRAW